MNLETRTVNCGDYQGVLRTILQLFTLGGKLLDNISQQMITLFFVCLLFFAANSFYNLALNTLDNLELAQ